MNKPFVVGESKIVHNFHNSVITVITQNHNSVMRPTNYEKFYRFLILLCDVLRVSII